MWHFPPWLERPRQQRAIYSVRSMISGFDLTHYSAKACFLDRQIVPRSYLKKIADWIMFLATFR